MSKYAVGDVIVVTQPDYGLVEAVGTIRAIDSDGDYCTEFDQMPEGRGGSCFGKITSRKGAFVQDKHILRKVEKSMGKFFVGDKVMVRFYPDMVAQFGESESGRLNTSLYFNPEMKKFCGKQFIISNMSSQIQLKDVSSWKFCPEFLMLVEKAKPAPEKKKLTVAEVEKLLGYGVEVVRG